jgi:4-hydroxy-3-polyprenylbenzoate decarboxylase
LAPPRDLREWIALLEREGELRRISAEADPDLEITEITDRVVKSGGPALMFEKPKGFEHPLLINQFGTQKRMCMAFGVETLDDAAAKLGDILDMQPPEGLREKVRGLLKLKSVADSRPKSSSRARTSTSAGCQSSAAGRATPRHSSRSPPSSRKTRTPAFAMSGCTACR